MDYFDKVIGYEGIKAELVRLVDILANYEQYEKLGVKMPKGLLLHGAPGVGKTLMANCFVNAVGRKTFICRKSKANDSFVDEIKHCFEQAAKNQPSIILLDDLDKFANADDTHRNAAEYVTVQTCIDEVADKEVFVLATANDIQILPTSLVRVGRFDHIIGVGCPRGDDARNIIGHYLSQKGQVKGVDIDEIARIMRGRSCAELETVINEAGIFAGYARKDFIDMDDILRACMRVIFKAPEELGVARRKNLKEIAYHEAGHVVVHEMLEPGSVNLVSVLQSASDFGGVTSTNFDDHYDCSFVLRENQVVSLLGGRAATEIVFGLPDVGSSGDMRQAASLVEDFVVFDCVYGFGSFRSLIRNASNDKNHMQEIQIASRLEDYYVRAKRLLIDNRKFLDKVAEALIEKTTLRQKDITLIRQTCE